MTNIIEILTTIYETFSQGSVILRLILSLLLLGLLVLFSKKQKINMEQMFLVSFARGFIQIILMGSILIFIFGVDSLLLLYLVLFIMCVFASYTTATTLNYPGAFRIALFAITGGGLIVMTFAIFSGLIPYTEHVTLFVIGKWDVNLPIKTTGEFVIPMGSMVLANSMVIGQITMERMKSDIIKSEGMIEAALALGDQPRNTIKTILQESFRAGLVPTTSRVAVLGIVNIPGLMSGMIIGGLNPIEAAIYQIVIFLLILVAAFIGSFIISFLFPRTFFTSDDQLNLSLIRKLAKNDTKSTTRKKAVSG